MIIDPILIKIGPLTIRWYSLAYIFGIFLGLLYIEFLNKKVRNTFFSKKIFDELILPIILGIIIGGRLGYVIFYNINYYFHNLVEIFKTWKGGMSFHGGAIGLTFAIYLFCTKKRLPFLQIMDLIVAAAPIGIFFGRIANFINGELYGRPSKALFSLQFLPYETFNRHPTQLYEAFSEGLLTFIIVNIVYIKLKLYKTPGRCCGVFLITYSLFRILIENFREPDQSVGFIFSYFTMGQILSIPLFILGVNLFQSKFKRASFGS